MQPHLIESTARSSLTLLGEHGRGTPEALLLAWVAWEGLKIRTLVVALAMHGWKVQDIYDSLADGRVHTSPHITGLFRELFGTYPQSTRGIGQTWTQIEGFREIRNRYVHGTRGSSPLKLEAGVHLITECVLDPGWLAKVPLRVDGEVLSLGHPYRRLPGRRTAYRTKKDLRELIDRARPPR